MLLDVTAPEVSRRLYGTGILVVYVSGDAATQVELGTLMDAGAGFEPLLRRSAARGGPPARPAPGAGPIRRQAQVAPSPGYWQVPRTPCRRGR